MKANVIKISFLSCLGVCWVSRRQMVPEHFMWMWTRVVNTEMENVPPLEGPGEDGVVLGAPEFLNLHRAHLPSSACLIPGAGSPHEISWRWLCCWDTDARMLHSKLSKLRILEMMLWEAHWEKWIAFGKKTKKVNYARIDHRSGVGKVEQDREEMKRGANCGCPVPLEWPLVWGVQNLLVWFLSCSN